MSIFSPHVMAQKCGYANFAFFGSEWLKKNPKGAGSENPFTDPDFTDARQREIEALMSVSWIYGGWMEDRSGIWSDTYLKETGSFLHLGVDISVPAGTEVFAIAGGEILHTGNDTPFKGGWGGHVVQRIHYKGEDLALIYAHLGKILATKNNQWGKGDPIGAIGKKDENGYWAPHLHLQLIGDIAKVADWQKFLNTEVDGYGKVTETEYWSRRCPDPTPLIFS